MRDLYCFVNGIKTRYWVCGDGPPVVLIHGLGASVEFWERNMAALGERFRVYALDLVGFGRTDKPNLEPSLEMAVRHVIGFLDAQGVERASLVGNSMGGLIALVAAGRFPERVEKLVLVDSAGLGRRIHWGFRALSLPGIGALAMRFRPNVRSMRLVRRYMCHDPNTLSDEWLARRVEMLQAPEARRALFTTLRYGVNLWGVRPHLVREADESLAHVTAPTLVVWGREDRMLPLADAMAGWERIPGARLEVWEGCGHVPQLEKPDEFNRLVTSFLSESVTPLER
ncbi:MAG: alpha/beta fold hydrolase [Anaerolineae bacterium]